MTDNEAIRNLNNLHCKILHNSFCNKVYDSEIKALAEAQKAIEEVKQYRSIGTVSECREAVKKRRAKKREIESYCGFKDFVCPTCRTYLHCESQYCHKCGQKLK